MTDPALEWLDINEFLDRPVPPRDWGPWRLDCDGPDDLYPVLTHRERAYEVALYECRTSPRVLDRIAQVASKEWADDATVAGLVRALDEVLGMQANLCGCGVSKRLSRERARDLAARAIESRTPDPTP